MSEVLTTPAPTVPEAPAAPLVSSAVVRDDRLELKGEPEDPSFLIISLRRHATSMGVLGMQLPEGRKGIERPMPVWETGGNGALRRLLIQDRSQMSSNMAAAEQERNFLIELTRRTTLKHAPAVETRIEWPGFGQQTA